MITEPSAQMTLISHLLELRKRLMRVFLVLLIIFLALFAFANDIYEWLSVPLRAEMPEGTSMIATDVISPFMAPLKFTFFVSLMISMPYVLYELWSFIAPGLYKKEKKVALPLFLSSVMLFYIGIAFAYFVIIKSVMAFMIGIAPESVSVMTDINSYLSFVLKLFFAFGMGFEIPIAVILLVRAGVLSSAALAQKRGYIVVGCFVVAMFLTPPDVFSQLFLAVPMWILFEIGLLFAQMLEVKNENPS